MDKPQTLDDLHGSYALDHAERYSVADYCREYSNGWRTSARGGSLDGPNGTTLHSDAWEDGYLDHAAGRERWHLPRCARHHNDTGGCGKA